MSTQHLIPFYRVLRGVWIGCVVVAVPNRKMQILVWAPPSATSHIFMRGTMLHEEMHNLSTIPIFEPFNRTVQEDDHHGT